MLTSICALNLARDGREMQPRGTALFPCGAYRGDLRAYLAQQVPPHWHPELELVVMEEGTAQLHCAGGAFVLRPGMGCFVNAGVLHGMTCGSPGPCRYHSLVLDPALLGPAGTVFDLRYLRPVMEKGPRALLLNPETPWHSRMLAAFEEAFAACAEEPAGYEFAVRDAFSRVLLELISHCGEELSLSRPKAAQEARLKQMLAYLNEHYADAITLPELAGSANICARECERAFFQILHLSPMSYLLRRRVAAATGLLADTDLPLTEIGLRCGFASPSYFSKQFKLITGESPRACRARLRSGQRGAAGPAGEIEL